MKNNIVILSPHSFIDVITNSSSELFVGDSGKSIDLIKEIIQNFLDAYNKADDSTYKLEDIMIVYKIDESNAELMAEMLMDWDAIPCGMDVEQYIRPDYHEMNFKEYHKLKDDYDVEWKSKNLDKLKSGLIGKVVIESTEDNGIPHELFEILEYTVLQNGNRTHLG